MARLPNHFNIGNRRDLTIEDLLLIIERVYEDLAFQVNRKPDLYERSSDGLTSDVELSQGSININTGTGKVEMLTSHDTTTTVTWTTLS